MFTNPFAVTVGVGLLWILQLRQGSGLTLQATGKGRLAMYNNINNNNDNNNNNNIII